MGNARWDAQTWRSHAQNASVKSQQQIFTNRTLVDDLNPAKVKFRESVDSENNPQSTPIILASDVTGSMGYLAEQIIKESLGKIMDSIYKHKPVTDPHICCMAVGDGFTDSAPLQVTQFEASVDPLTKQVAQIFIEGNGGGNGGESYALAWWFAAFKVLSDCVRRRGRKGYIFTIGDECCHPNITVDQIRRILGVPCEEDIPVDELLKIVEQHWHVYHLIVKPHSHQPVKETWKKLLNERAIMVSNVDKLAEIIITLISTNEGINANKVIDDFDEDGKTEARKLLTAN